MKSNWRKKFTSQILFSACKLIRRIFCFLLSFRFDRKIMMLEKTKFSRWRWRIISKTLIRVERSRTWGVFGDELLKQRKKAFRGLNLCDKTKVAYYYNSSNRIYAKQRKRERKGDGVGGKMLQEAKTLFYISFHFHLLLPDFLEINMKLSKRFLVPVRPKRELHQPCRIKL